MARAPGRREDPRAHQQAALASVHPCDDGGSCAARCGGRGASESRRPSTRPVAAAGRGKGGVREGYGRGTGGVCGTGVPYGVRPCVPSSHYPPTCTPRPSRLSNAELYALVGPAAPQAATGTRACRLYYPGRRVGAAALHEHGRVQARGPGHEQAAAISSQDVAQREAGALPSPDRAPRRVRGVRATAHRWLHPPTELHNSRGPGQATARG